MRPFLRSIGARFALGALATALVMVAPIGLAFDDLGEEQDASAFEEKGTALLRQLAWTVRFDFELEDETRLLEQLGGLGLVDEVAWIEARAGDGRPLAYWCRPGAEAVDCLVLDEAVHAASGEAIGSLAAGLDRAHLAVLDRTRHANYLVLVLGMVLAVTAAGALFGYLLNRRLQQLVLASRRISEGAMETRVAVGGRDEVGVLARSFNSMAHRLQQRETELVQARQEAERQAEAAQAAERAKSRFLATMSHEIRTPMNGVLGMADLLLTSELNEDQKDLVRTMRDSGSALLEILNDILDFSKVEAGRLELEHVVFDVGEVMEAAAELFAVKAHDKGVALDVLLEPGLPAQAVGDPGRLRQVLCNLIGNALKFTVAGSVSIRCLPAAGGGFRFEVVDTGEGIPEELQDRLFHAFVQADAAVARQSGGTGLGLALCRQFVELMGGRIGLSSEAGAGSTFWFELPLPVAEGDAKGARSLGGLRALVVSNAGVAAASRNVLLRLGASVECAHCEDDARVRLGAALAAGEPIQLVALEGEEPQELARAAARLGEAHCPAPVFLLVLPRPNLDKDAERAGFAAVARPLRAGKVATTVRGLLSSGHPAAPAGAAATGAGAAGASGSRPAEARGPRVLVADDNPVNRKVAGKMLESAGCEVGFAKNGAEAVAQALERDWDLVLMDLQMPVMDGLEAARKIRAEGGPRGAVPIFAVTANVLQEARQAATAAGMDGFLAKPFRMKEILQAVQDHSGRPRARS